MSGTCLPGQFDLRSPSFVWDRCQVEPIFHSETCIKVYVSEAWQLSGWQGRPGGSPLWGDSRAVFILSDSKSERWEKMGSISLKSPRHMFEDTWNIQDPVQICRSMTEPQRQWTGLESNVDKSINIIPLPSLLIIKRICLHYILPDYLLYHKCSKNSDWLYTFF